MMRRTRVGLSCALLFVGFMGIYPAISLGQQTTLQICVIANPGDTCDPSGGSSGGSSGGGGGGGGGGPSGGGGLVGPYSPTSGTVTLHGIAYPKSQITILRDGQFLAQTIAGPDASFEFDIADVTPGVYSYGIWAQDEGGLRSTTYTFTVNIAPGVGTIISGIFLPPTIDLDKSAIKRGDPISIFGHTMPGAQVTVLVHSSTTIMGKVFTDANGLWTYELNTTELEEGSHSVTAHSASNDRSTTLSRSLFFNVGSVTIAKKPTRVPVADLNGDGKINIVEFSILAYWYKRPLTEQGSVVDLNHDGKVDLKDFSILAYYWTG